VKIVYEIVRDDTIEGEDAMIFLDHQHCWANTMNNDIHNNDTLWIWTGQTAHEWMTWHQAGSIDLVLHCIFAMGLFDWEGEDVCINQTTPAMCHTTVMGCQLFRHILSQEEKVC